MPAALFSRGHVGLGTRGQDARATQKCYHRQRPPGAEAMILHVEFDQFAPTVQRLLKTKEAFTRLHGGTVVVTAAHPEKPFVVASAVQGKPLDVKQRLEASGFEVLEGEWTDAGEGASDRLGD